MEENPKREDCISRKQVMPQRGTETPGLIKQARSHIVLNLSISKEPREEVNCFFKSDFLHKSDQHRSEIQEKQRCFMLQEEKKSCKHAFLKHYVLATWNFSCAPDY